MSCRQSGICISTHHVTSVTLYLVLGRMITLTYEFQILRCDVVCSRDQAKSPAPRPEITKKGHLVEGFKLKLL